MVLLFVFVCAFERNVPGFISIELLRYQVVSVCRTVHSCVFFKSIYIPRTLKYIQYLSLSVYFPIMFLCSFLCLLTGWLWLTMVNQYNTENVRFLTRLLAKRLKEIERENEVWYVYKTWALFVFVCQTEDLLETVQPFSSMSPFDGSLLNAHLMEDSCLHILLQRQFVSCEWRKCI